MSEFLQNAFCQKGIFKRSWLVKKWRCLSHFDKRWILKNCHGILFYIYIILYIYIETTFLGDRLINPGHDAIWRIVKSIMVPHHRHVPFFEPSLGYERYMVRVLTCWWYPYHPWDWYIYVYLGVSENYGTPQVIHFNRVFHYSHHPCWGTAIFGNIHLPTCG